MDLKIPSTARIPLDVITLCSKHYISPDRLNLQTDLLFDHTRTYVVFKYIYFLLSMSFLSLIFCQMDLVSESQQRKRKAPAPPPTPASSIPGPDDTYYTTAASTPDSHATETSTPVFYTRVTKSTTVSDTNLITQTVKPAPLRMAAQTPSVGTSTPNHSSPTPSSSTTDSLAIQDSSSDLSHSLEDSDLDPDQTISNCSTLSSSTVSVSVQGQAIKKRSSSRMEERDKASSMANKLNQEPTSASISRSENESALNLKLDEVENSRHSAMGKYLEIVIMNIHLTQQCTKHNIWHSCKKNKTLT